MKNGYSILLSEDEQSLGSIIAENLGSAGFFVTHVLSGHDALEALKTQAFSIIVLDVMMPGINGFELAVRSGSPVPWCPYFS